MIESRLDFRPGFQFQNLDRNSVNILTLSAIQTGDPAKEVEKRLLYFRTEKQTDIRILFRIPVRKAIVFGFFHP